MYDRNCFEKLIESNGFIYVYVYVTVYKASPTSRKKQYLILLVQVSFELNNFRQGVYNQKIMCWNLMPLTLNFTNI